MVLKTLEKPPKKHKRGLWSPEEDQRLKDYVLQHGIGCWSSVPINAGLQRNGKSCRLRWINYLRPGLKRGMFSPQEEELILTLHHTLGNKWSQIARQLPGRTDNEVKNYWHSYLKKKTMKSGEDEEAKYGNILNTKENDYSFVLSPSIRASRIEGESRAQVRGQESVLPRVIFAEWLPDDNTEGQIGQSRYMPNEVGFTAEKQEDFMLQGFGYDEAVGSSSSSDGKFCQEAGDVIQEEMLLKFQDYQSAFVSDFMDFSAGNMMNNGFLSLPIPLYKEALF